jgi:voltage-gated potassium channel
MPGRCFVSRLSRESIDDTRRGSRSLWWVRRRLEADALRPRTSAYIIAGFWALAVIVIGVVEWRIDPKTFHTVWLGLWWAVETVTTVGYGDVVPQQTAGKVIAAFLMLGGLSLLSVITAAITRGFVSRAESEREARRPREPEPAIERLDQLAAQLAEIKAELSKRTRAAASNEGDP